MKSRSRTNKTLLGGITFLLIFAISGYAAAQTCFTPPSGLVSSWPGDGDANDIVGSNHGTLQNGAAFVPGLVDQAFRFDGIDDFVHIPNHPSLTVSTEFTIDFWFNPNESYDTLNPVAPVFLSKGFPYSINIANNDGRFEVRGPVPRPNSITETWLVGTWSHIAVTFDATGYKIYVNGTQEGSISSSVSILNNSNDIALGVIPGFQNDTDFNGLMDEIEVFNRALSASEIQSIYNAGSTGKCRSVSFNTFSIAKARVKLSDKAGKDKFKVEGSYELNLTDGNGIDPVSEEVTIIFDGFSETIEPGPGGFFDVINELGAHVGFQYNGSGDGVKRIVIRDDGKFKVKAKGLDVNGIDLNNAVLFSVQIGDDKGTTEGTMDILFDEDGVFKP